MRRGFPLPRGMRAQLMFVALALAVAATTPPTSFAADAGFAAHGSVEQVYVTGLGPGAQMSLVSPRRRVVATHRADALGGLVFRGVAPGDGYRVRVPGTGTWSGPLTVLSTRPAPPSTGIYDQSIPSSGYGYMTMRDGIKLAYYVHPPQDVATALPGGVHPPGIPGVFPTLIEYSGYGYADPAGPQSGISVIANLMGFAVVDVNMRGTGCSGGAFDFFEPSQSLDGYDVIETVARQPWVLHHKVGMMGISYGGISQLFTAQTDPPSLAAISPLSVIDQTQTTLYPGGILNTGFALAWAKERVHDALPASATGGQSWAYKQIQSGDGTCKDNQVLHGEAVDLLAKTRANSHYVPAVADPLSPITFVNKIKVPVYLACQWTDEQTGGHCADLAEHFTGTQHKWFTFTNGDHIDSLDPETFNRWYDFLELYVAQQAPITNSAAHPRRSPARLSGGDGDQRRVASAGPDPGAADLRRRPGRVRASCRRSGCCSTTEPDQTRTGRSRASSDRGRASRFPAPRPARGIWDRAGHWRTRCLAAARSISSGGTPTRGRSTISAATPPGEPMACGPRLPSYNWVQPPPGSGVSYLTAPLTGNTTVIGAGALRVWVRSATSNVDLQATVTEVRPDGKETFVQNGWLRANEAKLDPDQEHVARARPQPPSLRRGAPPTQAFRPDHDPALLRGPRVSRGVADSGDRHRPERRSADLGIQPDEPAREG